jgi:carbonic anhydrase/acetyltransferase-like protein (isoleucine patch superfamily)
MIEALGNIKPAIAKTAFVHERATVVGQVVIEEYASIWPGAVLRGDMGEIRIGARTSIQDGTICHMTSGLSSLLVGSNVTVGHGAILHGAIVEDECLIGMGSILLDNVVIGRGSFVAAGSLITPNKVIPPGSFVMGSPARVVRSVREHETQWILESAKSYVEVIAKYTRK